MFAQKPGVVTAVVCEVKRGRADLEFRVLHRRKPLVRQAVELALEPLPQDVDLLVRLDDGGQHQGPPQAWGGVAPQGHDPVHQAARFLDVGLFARRRQAQERVAIIGSDFEDPAIPLLRFGGVVAVLQRARKTQHDAGSVRVGR